IHSLALRAGGIHSLALRAGGIHSLALRAGGIHSLALRAGGIHSLALRAGCSSQLSGYWGSSSSRAGWATLSGRAVSIMTASSSVRVTDRLAVMVPGWGPWGMPRGWRVIEASATPRRLPNRPRT